MGNLYYFNMSFGNNGNKMKREIIYVTLVSAGNGLL